MSRKEDQELQSLREQYRTLGVQISEMERRIKQKDADDFRASMALRAWDGWQYTKVSDLASKTREQVEFLFYHHGYGYPKCGDWHVSYLRGEERAAALHRYRMDVLTGESCKYCKSIFHKKEKCPKLLEKQQTELRKQQEALQTSCTKCMHCKSK